MKKITQIYFLIIMTFPSFAQDYPIAPEVWSEPVLLDSVFLTPFAWDDSPALTVNFDTIYFTRNDILMSFQQEGKWVEPIKLNENINDFSAKRHSSLGRNGKRIYFSAWAGYGGWDIWYSDWDTETEDWGIAQNLGPDINTSGDEYYVFEASEDTLYCIQSIKKPNLYVFDSLKSTWTKVDNFLFHQIGAGDMEGMSITADRKKLYFGRRYWPDDLSDETRPGLELCVVYWDSTTNYWGDTYYLNINTITVPWENQTKGGVEYDPWISPDGKTMIFSSNRDAPTYPDSNDNSTNLYISRLLVDENGDSVTSINIFPDQIPNNYRLYQNYPNPFNPETHIKFQIPSSEHVTITVYNTIGENIETLVDQYLLQGEYEIVFNAKKTKIPSGPYFYILQTSKKLLANKMLHLK